jgi:hypothetical protein
MTHEQVLYALLHAHVQYSFLGALLALAPLVAKLFGKTEDNRTQARVATAAANQNQDAQAINRAVVDNTLTQSKQDDAYKNSLRAGIQDYHVTRPDGVPDGHATGGLRPSAYLGGNALGAQFKDADLASIMAGTPKLTPPPQANGFDKFLNIGSGIAGLLGLGGNVASALKSPTTPIPNVSAHVNTDPSALINTLPSIGNTAITPPQQSTYRPKFTMPQSRF